MFTYRKVRLAANVGLCEGVDGLGSYSEVTQFDLAMCVDQDV